jgi:DivIVA domain-containing protein
MAQEPDAEKRGSVIALAGKRKWGYDTTQVDDFLEKAHALYESDEPRLGQEDIQNVSFELVKNGYVIAQVDAALARLERAVVDKRTSWEINQHGRVAWRAQTESMFQKYSEHASRAAKERFADGKSKQPSYKRSQVDRLIEQISKKLAIELGQQRHADDAKELVDLNAKRVSNVIFTQRRGKRGYDERQVDYFLNFAIQLLSRVESYVRVNDYTPAEETRAAEQAASQDALPTAFLADQATGNGSETQVVAPLFDMSARNTRVSRDEDASSFATEPLENATLAQQAGQDDDFNRLNAAEKAIFQSSVAPSTAKGEQNNAEANTALTKDSAQSEDLKQAHDGARSAHEATPDDASTVQAGPTAVTEPTLHESLSFPGSVNPSLAALAQTPQSETHMPEGYGERHDNSETQISGSPLDQRHAEGGKADSGSSFTVEDAATERFDPLSVSANGAQPRSWAPQQTPSTDDRDHTGESATSGQRHSSADSDASYKSAPQQPSAVGGYSKPQEFPVTANETFTAPSSDTAVPSAVSSAEATVASFTAPTATPESQADKQTETSDNSSNRESQDPDTYLAELTSLLDSSTFPKVDLDIPDLSFPGFDEGDSKPASSTQPNKE